MRERRIYLKKEVFNGTLTQNNNSSILDLGEIFLEEVGAAVVSQAPSVKDIGFEKVAILIDVSARSGSSPTLTAKLEVSDDISDEPPQFIDTGKQITGINAVGKSLLVVSDAYWGRYLRLAFTLGGTSPSFTFKAVIKAII